MDNTRNTLYKLMQLEGSTLLRVDDVNDISEIIKEKVKELGNI